MPEVAVRELTLGEAVREALAEELQDLRRRRRVRIGRRGSDDPGTDAGPRDPRGGQLLPDAVDGGRLGRSGRPAHERRAGAP